MDKISQNIFIGESSIDHFKKILGTKNYHSVFLVRGRNSYEKCGAKNILESVFSLMNIRVTEFIDFSENPKAEDLSRGLALFNEKSVDVVIAVGGGSVLDMGKLIRFFVSYKGEIGSLDFKYKKKLISLIAIPTTAGTGSEATHFAVVYKEKVKYSIAHKDILPDMAIIDPSFTYNINPYLTACTGFDALAQAIEAYWNVNATDESDEYSLKAIKLLWHNLPKVVEDGSLRKERNNLSEGAHYAGKAINITKTTLPHAMSYPFTSYYGFPHGHAVALTFPFAIMYNTSGVREDYNKKLDYIYYQKKMDNLLSLLNINKHESIFKIFYDYIKNLGLSFDLPSYFKKTVIMDNVNELRAKNNPRTLTEEAILLAISSIRNGNSMFSQ